MIKEFEFYHGVVLSKLVHYDGNEVKIKLYPSPTNASYILNNNIGLYIKHSTKRMSPWRFTFQRDHQDEIAEMAKRQSEMFLLLVCGEDGIVVLNFQELKVILDHFHQETEWISATRTKNTEYTIKGSDGKLKYKVGKKDFPRKIFSMNNSIDYLQVAL
ncbi:hypothetical protein [Flavobacterium silvaticum]|uniref:Uncharacterized protein n=1 Tax=Flavobacterium silvaticum TaxID=1852020 RepID=A0A972FNX6_9FLAO|nr:hypothetical protein [Flavobacterium silvaticum]NMH28720.1 hypothetical protein [Flavobacterium silvaticum]